MLNPGSHYNPGPFKPKGVPPVRPPKQTIPATPPIFNKYPGPMKPPPVPLPPRPFPQEPAPPIEQQVPPEYQVPVPQLPVEQKVPPEYQIPQKTLPSRTNSIFSPGAGFGQNDVLEAIFQKLGY